jgi:acyl-CoA synthetase (AMP-forming)/AMP-acid ligase II
MLMSGEIDKHDLSSLKRITYGTEVMPPTTLARVRDLFPTVELQQTYGLSELGVLRTKSKSDGSLWVKVGGEGFQTKVVDGTLWIKSDSAMIGYLNAPQPFDSDGWFNTEDRVLVDGDYIRILGRSSEIVNVGGQKVFPSEVEATLMEMSNVEDAVVRGEPNPLMGMIVAASIRLAAPEDLAAFRRRMMEFCSSRLSDYKIPMRVDFVDSSLVNSRFKRQRTRL